MNFYSLIRERSHQAATFILSPTLEPRYSYTDLHALSGGYANRLAALGVRPGDRVIVQVQKSAECLFTYLACLRLGAVYLPLNTAYLDDELAYFVADATPTLIVCDPDRVDYFASLGTGTVVTLDQHGHGSLAGQIDPDADAPICSREDADTAVILYTSGTTGRPKGAMITHGNLAVNAVTLLKAWRWQPEDVMLHALPIFHIHGLFVGIHLPLLNGSPVILLPAFDPVQVADLLPEATVYMGVPTNYTRLLASGRLTRSRCSNMRLFTSGSAPLLEATFNEFRDVTDHEIVERYGMTETGMNTSNPLDGIRKPGTVGLPLSGVTARIVDEADRDLPDGEPGNLLIKGDNVFTGYWQLPEKTAEEFTSDGFFRTGDIAVRDRDGYIAIVGRDKDMIISGGLNIYPKEIESVIDDMDGVQESAVIGLPHRDFGEGVCAVVVVEHGSNLTESDIIKGVKARLASFKVPKWVYFDDSLPRNTMGKVQKNLLREKYAN